MGKDAQIFNNIELQKEKVPFFLEQKERQALLEKYHPDYSTRGKREVAFGSNKGSLLPAELVELIEKESIYPSSTNNVTTDLLVVGSGAAGICAALAASHYVINITLVTKENLGSSNTILAQGGIAAAISKEDSPILHAKDTMKSGITNSRKLANNMTEEALNVISWLESKGMEFAKDDHNRYRLLSGGGHTVNRVLPYQGRIGVGLMKLLLKMLKKSSVDSRSHHKLIKIITGKGHCLGAVVHDLRNDCYITYKSKAVILATGGLGGLNPLGFPSTNHRGIRGEGLAIAYKAGAELVDMDSLQFHPTGVLWPEPVRGLLVSEQVRSAGANLFNRSGLPFINPLETRDIVTASILREIAEGRGISTPVGSNGVILDTSALQEKTLKTYLGKIYEKLQHSKISPGDIPLIVGPYYHYQNGGLAIDTNCKTNLEGLWAAGEVTGGVHGKNRLSGNALTDAFVFGQKAGHAAARTILAKHR